MIAGERQPTTNNNNNIPNKLLRKYKCIYFYGIIYKTRTELNRGHVETRGVVLLNLYKYNDEWESANAIRV